MTVRLVAVLASCWAPLLFGQADGLRRGFTDPPADARPMMRWWWFGPAVTKPELECELRTMQQNGIGGVEIQPVYPLALDDVETGIRNLPYLSDEFIDRRVPLPSLAAGEELSALALGQVTAMNYMAGPRLPDYRLLHLRYGPCFDPQDMDKIAVLPSGLLGPVRPIGVAE